MPTRRNSEIASPRLRRRRPALLAGLAAMAIGMVAPPAQALATSPGEVYAFGDNHYGQLGNTTNNGINSPNPTPALVSLPGASGPATEIAAGYEHSLVLTSSGQLFAFGENRYGQLGSATNNGTSDPNPTPALVPFPTGTTVDTATSGVEAEHTLVLIANLTVASSSLPSGEVGVPYHAGAEAAGGTAPFAWQAGGLPAGLSIDAASGQIDGTPTAAGTAQVVPSVTDRYGATATGAPLALRIERARPAISGLRQSHRRWRGGRGLARTSSTVSRKRKKGRRAPLGTIFTFRLNRRARVKFAFARLKKGRKTKHGRSNPKRGKGKRFKKAGALVFAGHPGKNRVRFQGRISRRKRLKPGRYKLVATAKSGGTRSKPRSLRFRIVR